MNCRSARARIDAAADGRLAIEDVLELEAHAAACGECRALLSSARALEEALSRLDDPSAERVDVERSVRLISRAIEREIGREIGQSETGSRSRPAPLRLWRWTALAAAALVLLALGLWSLSRRAQPAAMSPRIEHLAAGAEPALRAVQATSPERAAPEESVPVDAIDALRLADARARARELLLGASARLPSEADSTASLTQLALDINASTRDLAREGWPILRLCESLIDDADPRVARTALRYLGLRGDQLSIAAIKRASARPELRVTALFALIDAGEAGSESVQSAIHDTALRRPVLARLIARGTDDAARGMERALCNASPDTARATLRPDAELSRDVLAALAELGERGVPSLLRLGSDRVVSADDCLAALERTRGASGALADLLERRPRDLDIDLVLQAVGRLSCTQALAFVEEMGMDAQHKVRAIDVLATLGGMDALKALFRLRVADSSVAPALSRALSGDGHAVCDLVRECTQLGRKRELKILCDALFENAVGGSPSGSPPGSPPNSPPFLRRPHSPTRPWDPGRLSS